MAKAVQLTESGTSASVRNPTSRNQQAAPFYSTALLRLCCAVLLIGTSGALRGEQRQKSGTALFQYSVRQAKMVMDLAFPKDRLPDTALSLVVRFEPSSQPPSQIVIRYLRGSPVLVDYMIARKSPARALLEQSLTTSEPDVQAAVKLMGVKRYSAEAPTATARKWLDAYWLAFRDSTSSLEKTELDYVVQMDGTLYTVEYADTRYSMLLVLPGPELGYESADDLAVIKWMLTVRKDVEALLKEPQKIPKSP